MRFHVRPPTTRAASEKSSLRMPFMRIVQQAPFQFREPAWLAGNAGAGDKKSFVRERLTHVWER